MHEYKGWKEKSEVSSAKRTTSERLVKVKSKVCVDCVDPEATPKYFSRSLVGNLARFSRLASFFEIVCFGLPNGPRDGGHPLYVLIHVLPIG